MRIVEDLRFSVIFFFEFKNNQIVRTGCFSCTNINSLDCFLGSYHKKSMESGGLP